jgi:hypothetical protein
VIRRPFVLEEHLPLDFDCLDQARHRCAPVLLRR